MLISIHAAREGGDKIEKRTLMKFRISIHAAREGGDMCAISYRQGSLYFNPRRP